MQLSKYFTLEEMTASDVAARRDIPNIPNTEQRMNLDRLARCMDKVRELLQHPIHINSGFRSPLVNASVGGVSTSAHCDGRACDFICPAFGTPLQVAHKIADSGIVFDQLIFEFGVWVHFAIADKPRRQVLTKLAGQPYTPGLPGLPKQPSVAT